ncbi:stimulus-sensing domain-containing protein [Pseudahrensia aquimaris]|uniref:histidine kinase n=1 Tax=Pseudahrensia aquimaris TaxID=744461 RepID=A0ABW3FH08_9HYPH
MLARNEPQAPALPNDATTPSFSEPPASPKRRKRSGLRNFISRTVFSTLGQRILLINILGLLVLVSGILYLNQFRESLIEARVESLLTQGEIISGAIGSRATVETDALAIDIDKLAELRAGESIAPNVSESLDFPIDPEEVAPVLRRLISPTRTRARIFAPDGEILLDSARLFYSRGQILRFDLPPPDGGSASLWQTVENTFNNIFFRSNLPIYTDPADGNGTAYSEVVTALTGVPASKTRRTVEGDTIVSVAVPVQRSRAILGVLLLSTQAGDIDKIIRGERQAIGRTFAVALLVTLLLSYLLASTIAKPLKKLSAAAERVRLGVRKREEIPDFSDRHDEIGHLSTSLRDMTDSLYNRIEAIERFAADVSHELKNPLTSLRSAVETLPLAKRDEQRESLLAIIQHDVRRLDRLISDISDASRLDAELAREDAANVDLVALLESINDTYSNIARNTKGNSAKISLTIENQGDARRTSKTAPRWIVSGHEGRLGQVMANLIENARTFVPERGGQIDVTLRRRGNRAIITVADNGPGIDPENFERVFERFYTDRPGAESFGQNSGLGLSITRQIIDAHNGTIKAGNIMNNDTRLGAIFTVSLPLNLKASGVNG